MWLISSTILLTLAATKVYQRKRLGVIPMIPENHDLLYSTLLVLWVGELDDVFYTGWQPQLMVCMVIALLTIGTIATIRLIRQLQQGNSLWETPYPIWLSLILMFVVITSFAGQ